MLHNPTFEERCQQLAHQLQRTPTVTDDLIFGIITDLCARVPRLSKTGPAVVQLHRLIQACAWTDTALALVQLESPGWKLRRLVHEDGEWLCSLSKQPNLPMALDNTADGRHENLPLAVLTAFVEARRVSDAEPEPCATTVPQVYPVPGIAVYCDNFS